MLDVRSLLEHLEHAYGAQNWWPAETAFEVVVGAVLVQRTTWSNAETAISSLRTDRLLSCEALASVDVGALEQRIRSAGFYRTKAARLQEIAAFFSRAGGIEGLGELPTEKLREVLLSLKGIGAETADAIVLYAYDRPVWVIDAYSRRLLERMSGRNWSRADERAYVEPLVRAGETKALQDLHALIVEHGKRRCTTAPKCEQCALQLNCAFGSGR